jgi:hypothetical protein
VITKPGTPSNVADRLDHGGVPPPGLSVSGGNNGGGAVVGRCVVGDTEGFGGVVIRGMTVVGFVVG